MSLYLYISLSFHEVEVHMSLYRYISLSFHEVEAHMSLYHKPVISHERGEDQEVLTTNHMTPFRKIVRKLV
jgi:hypothetical protein